MNTNINIREEFLNFFEDKNHEIKSSMNLVPDDASLLFTNAGMIQFKDIFTGTVPTPPNPRATSTQLCVRAGGKHNDLENVGYTSRHHTLFEMLGNFSFGDYFKAEAIDYAWEFITEVIKLPKDKLWVTIHDSDDEAEELWLKHIDKDRIKRFGDKDNFWQMGDTGACGPCSEIFYDQGIDFPEAFTSDEDYLGGEGDRFLEIWNLVFMQYEKAKDGTLTPLPKPSIDTGMGLERVQAILEGKTNNFQSSLFMPMIEKISEFTGQTYVFESGASYRVIADHIRAVSFMLSHGVRFDKEGRGYVLRRILRRAVRHGYLLGLKNPFMYKLVDTLCEQFGDYYIELNEHKEYIKEQIELEEARFYKTIDSGMVLFDDELQNTKEVFSGAVAFKLYDTFGFPLDLTQDMLREKNLQVDIDEFDRLMGEQKAKAKASWKGSGDSASEGDFKILLQKHGHNNFVGYQNLSYKSKIIELLDDDFNEIKNLQANQTGWVMLNNTPFYAQSGGQVGDSGILELDGKLVAKISDTKKFFGLNLSKIKVLEAIDELHINLHVNATVKGRDEIAKHHSATHLLQSALREVLGDGVTQAGSLNDDKRLRFDFTYPKAMDKEQILKVETLVNKMINDAIQTNIEELPIEEAKTRGAIAMFGEKYGDMVRVISFDKASVEFCGGTHVKNSAHIGSFYITKESGVSAGVRRIEAVCGLSAIKYAKSFMTTVANLEHELKSKDLVSGINRLKKQIKELKLELKSIHSQVETPLHEIDIDGTKVVVDIIQSGDIKQLIDDLKNGHDSIAVFLIEKKGEKVIMASGAKNCSIKAGDWIKAIAPIVGGGGGGRPDFAQAGGKDASKIEDAKAEALQYAKDNL
jgi:alanyl-tRNA synthetase